MTSCVNTLTYTLGVGIFTSVLGSVCVYEVCWKAWACMISRIILLVWCIV